MSRVDTGMPQLPDALCQPSTRGPRHPAWTAKQLKLISSTASLALAPSRGKRGRGGQGHGMAAGQAGWALISGELLNLSRRAKQLCTVSWSTNVDGGWCLTVAEEWGIPPAV